MRKTLNQDLNFDKNKSHDVFNKLLTPSNRISTNINGKAFFIAKTPLSSNNWGFNYTNIALGPDTYILTLSGYGDIWIAGSTKGEHHLVTNELSSYMDELVSFLGFSQAPIDLGKNNAEHIKDNSLDKLAKKGLQG